MTPGATLGGTQDGQTRARRGVSLGCAQGCMGPPWPLSSSSSTHYLLSPEKTRTQSSHSHFRCSCLQFSISLLSPSFLLRFGAFVPWYVNPPIIQVEFCLVEYFLSILLL